MPIIEDDTYRELYLGNPPPPSLHSLDTQSIVIHLNSFSKVLAPGLRLGWLSAAESIVDQLALIKQRADPHMQNLVQLVVADLIEDGTFDHHLVELRNEHRRRRDAVVAALRRHRAEELLQWTVADGGLYLWCRLRPRLNAATVLKRALAESVAFVQGSVFYVDHAGEKELRLCFSSIAVGRTDEIGLHAVGDRLHTHDFHATLLRLLGLDHMQLVYSHKNRPERPTLNEGTPCEKIISG